MSNVPPGQQCTLSNCSQPVADERARGGLCEEHAPDGETETCKDEPGGEPSSRQDSPCYPHEFTTEPQQNGDSRIKSGERDGESVPTQRDNKTKTGERDPADDDREDESGNSSADGGYSPVEGDSRDANPGCNAGVSGRRSGAVGAQVEGGRA